MAQSVPCGSHSQTGAQYLMAITCIGNGTGYSWSEAYHVKLVSLFDRYVAPQLTNCLYSQSYSDFAVLNIGALDNLSRDAAIQIQGNQAQQRDQRWQLASADVLKTNLIDKNTPHSIFRGKCKEAKSAGG